MQKVENLFEGFWKQSTREALCQNVYFILKMKRDLETKFTVNPVMLKYLLICFSFLSEESKEFLLWVEGSG